MLNRTLSSRSTFFRLTPTFLTARLTSTATGLTVAVCFFLALYGVIFASAVVTQKRTVQEADFWQAAGCDELCLQHGDGATPRISTMDFSDLF